MAESNPILGAAPCPFCRSSDLSILEAVAGREAIVHCEGCGAEGPPAIDDSDEGEQDMSAEAVRLWDQRPQEAVHAAQIERIERARARSERQLIREGFIGESDLED